MLQVVWSEGAHPSADGGGEARTVEVQMASVMETLLVCMAE